MVSWAKATQAQSRVALKSGNDTEIALVWVVVIVSLSVIENGVCVCLYVWMDVYSDGLLLVDAWRLDQ